MSATVISRLSLFSHNNNSQLRVRGAMETFMKPTVVLFGERITQSEVQQAFQLPREADLILMVGSSLVVFPAAEVPLVALRAGAPMILINAEPTPFDRMAEVVIHGRAGEVLPEIVRLIDA